MKMASIDWRYLIDYLKRTFRETPPQQPYIELVGFFGVIEIQRLNELCQFYDCRLESIESYINDFSNKVFWKSRIIISTNASFQTVLFQQSDNPEFLLNNIF